MGFGMGWKHLKFREGDIFRNRDLFLCHGRFLREQSIEMMTGGRAFVVHVGGVMRKFYSISLSPDLNSLAHSYGVVAWLAECGNLWAWFTVYSIYFSTAYVSPFLGIPPFNRPLKDFLAWSNREGRWNHAINNQEKGSPEEEEGWYWSNNIFFVPFASSVFGKSDPLRWWWFAKAKSRKRKHAKDSLRGDSANREENTIIHRPRKSLLRVSSMNLFPPLQHHPFRLYDTPKLLKRRRIIEIVSLLALPSSIFTPLSKIQYDAKSNDCCLYKNSCFLILQAPDSLVFALGTNSTSGNCPERNEAKHQNPRLELSLTPKKKKNPTPPGENKPVIYDVPQLKIKVAEGCDTHPTSAPLIFHLFLPSSHTFHYKRRMTSLRQSKWRDDNLCALQKLPIWSDLQIKFQDGGFLPGQIQMHFHRLFSASFAPINIFNWLLLSKGMCNGDKDQHNQMEKFYQHLSVGHAWNNLLSKSHLTIAYLLLRIFKDISCPWTLIEHR